MPRGPRKFAPKRKMIMRKRLARRPKRVLVNRALHPIPQRFITKMKYSEQFTTDSTTGAYRFNLNSIYDPNQSGTGHQPYGFDTLATLYNRYRVIACGWRINVNWASNSTAQPVLVGAIPANEALTFSTLSELRENPRAKYISQNYGGPILTLKGKSYLPSLVGRNKAQYMADDRYQATMTTNPNELAILNVMTGPSGLDTPGAATLQIVLEYTVEFFDIKHLAQS